MHESGTVEALASLVLDPLRADHKRVKNLFEEFEAATDQEEKRRIVALAIGALVEHAYVEETVLYPAFEPALDEESFLYEALEEHHVMDLLMSELKKMSADDPRFDAKFRVLAETVKHHILEEEEEMFIQVEESDLDWGYLSEKVSDARQRFSAKTTRSGKAIAKGQKLKSVS